MKKWISIKHNETMERDAFLREHEYVSVAPVAKMRKGLHKRDKIWKLCDGSGCMEALLLYSGRTLFPVLNGINPVPVPRFLRFFLVQYPIYAIQGLGSDVQQLEHMLAGRGLHVSDTKDFYLMKLDRDSRFPAARKSGLIIRKPGTADMDSLYELQKGYEIEEVIPRGASFSPDSCRYTVANLIAGGHVLAGEIDGRLVAKVNTNGESYTRYQIGGVYVEPPCRGKGYATEIVAALCRELLSEGKGINLFVKKSNVPALRVYQKLGFETISDYRISYY